MREHIVTKADMADFTPDKMVATLESKGFVFVSTVCPVMLAHPYSIEQLPNGAIRYTQGDMVQ